jgi:predicted DNA-binding ribbon-helix-helix protein
VRPIWGTARFSESSTAKLSRYRFGARTGEVHKAVMLRKRSISLAGHQTSLALEPEFWEVIDRMALARELPLAALIRNIDETRANRPLASACRVAALQWVRALS